METTIRNLDPKGNINELPLAGFVVQHSNRLPGIDSNTLTAIKPVKGSGPVGQPVSNSSQAYYISFKPNGIVGFLKKPSTQYINYWSA